MLRQIQEVAKFDSETALQFFTKSYIKYSHLGDSLEFVGPIKVSLKTIEKEDSEDKNIGRPERHTTRELQNIAEDMANGIKPYLDLPVIVKDNDPNTVTDFKLIAGYGTLNALGENGVDEYWFYEVLNATPTQLNQIATFENTNHISDKKYNTGEDGIIHHLKSEIARKHKDLINTEDSIGKYIDGMYPGITTEIRGRLISKAKNAQTKTRAFITYNATAVSTWLSEKADEQAQFIFGGKYDKSKDMYGYLSANTMDPIINAAGKFVETGKGSYVVLHVKLPGKNKTVKQMREDKVKQFKAFLDMLKALGVKNLNFIKILGFLPQDTKNEDMRFLVDVNGKSIKLKR